ncbi:MAG: hypothetical protein HY934_06915, partial [Candidatus Firestonebacteria bacterium]|nr:hypothetical protein [Candidatus Firestonebacteria bacterium]
MKNRKIEYLIITNILFLLFLLISNNIIYAFIETIPDNISLDIKNIYKKHGFDEKDKYDIKTYLKKDFPQIKKPNKNRCATSLIRELSIYISSCNPELKKILQHKYGLLRPTDTPVDPNEDYYGTGIEVKEYRTKHFIIHYVDVLENTHAVSRKDENSNGIPDIIESYETIIEECWDKETALFRAPIDDGDKYYDLYLLNLQNGPSPDAYAYANTDPTENHPLHSSTFIVMDNDYTDGSYPDITKDNLIDNIKVIFAHEFFHAIQNAYNSYATFGDIWFSEACATWMEDEIYDDINLYYYYLPDFFNNPELSLEHIISDNPGSSDWTYEYGECVLVKFLQAKYGITVIKEIWEYYEYYGDTYMTKPYKYVEGLAFNGLSKSLTKRNISFIDMLGDFRIACYFVGINYNKNFAIEDETQFYPPEVSVKISNVFSYPFKSFSSDPYKSPQGTGAYYMIFDSKSYESATLDLLFEGDTKTKLTWGGKIIKLKKDNSTPEVDNFKFEFDNVYAASIKIPDFGNIYSKVILIPYIINIINYNRFPFTIRAIESIPPDDVKNVYIQTLYDSDVKISWTNPSDKDLAGILILRNDSTEIKEFDTTNNKIVFNNLDTTFIDRGLITNKIYYYRIFSYDFYDNYSGGIDASIQVFDTTPPPDITSLEAIDDNTDGKVNLNWKTYINPPDIANFAVYFDTINFSEVNSKEPVKTLNQDIKEYQISGLQNGLQYYFAVIGIDRTGNKDLSVTAKKAIPTWDTTPPLPVDKYLTAIPVDSGK